MQESEYLNDKNRTIRSGGSVRCSRDIYHVKELFYMKVNLLVCFLIVIRSILLTYLCAIIMEAVPGGD